MQASFELFDHTADLGVRVRAPDMPSLAAMAMESLYTTIGRIETSGTEQLRRFEATGDEPVLMLRDLLADLLVEFETASRVLAHPSVEAFDAHQLVVTGALRPVDPARSEFSREVKAITYHDLALREIPGGFEFVYIVDI